MKTNTPQAQNWNSNNNILYLICINYLGRRNNNYQRISTLHALRSIHNTYTSLYTCRMYIIYIYIYTYTMLTYWIQRSLTKLFRIREDEDEENEGKTAWRWRKLSLVFIYRPMVREIYGKVFLLLCVFLYVFCRPYTIYDSQKSGRLENHIYTCVAVESLTIFFYFYPSGVFYPIAKSHSNPCIYVNSKFFIRSRWCHII